MNEVNSIKNVGRVHLGKGALASLSGIIDSCRASLDEPAVIFIDSYYTNDRVFLEKLKLSEIDKCVFIPTVEEPKTTQVNELMEMLRNWSMATPCAVVGIGGGITMDIAKAVSNLYSNIGLAEDYQGWDLLKNPGIFKIAVPTISGTGAEATRTCVMTNVDIGVKLGMNSDFSIFDAVIMDHSLTSTVPQNQYFFTGMDAYIHCVEALSGSHRNIIGDAYCEQTLSLCRDVFLSRDMMSEKNREKLMLASYFGGCAIATSFVGLVHPLSAGLSVVLGLHHCVANCIVMRAMKEYYPAAYLEFWEMADRQKVEVPSEVCISLDDRDFDKLYEATIVHEKPLKNALGSDFREILTRSHLRKLFEMM